jgi:hypothetical protein
LPFEKCIFVTVNLFVLPTVQFLQRWFQPTEY